MSFKILKTKRNLVSTQTKVQSVSQQQETTVNSTPDTVRITLPTDMLLYAIDIRVATSTVGLGGAMTNADNLLEARLILDGNKYIKRLTGGMIKAIMLMNGIKASTGYYRLFCVDPNLPTTDPIPLQLVTSAVLECDGSAAGSTLYNSYFLTLDIGLASSYPQITNFSQARILVEKYLQTVNYSTNTGQQNYPHERTYNIFGYVYEFGDNGTLSDTKFDWITLRLINASGELDPLSQLYLTQWKEKNTQECLGNALPTGEFFFEFPDAMQSMNFTSIYSVLDIPTAGTNIQVKVAERYILS